MALADVVSRLASTKSTNVAAYASAIGAMLHVHPRRVLGIAASNTIAATSERKLATCQPVRDAALKTAPPVEKSSAAKANNRRWRTGEFTTLRYHAGVGPTQPAAGHRDHPPVAHM